ncbi:MAG TPA: hypothetical protein VE596_02690 [Gaiellaceae bacterium]|jgi:hypothetical protein|nr:hypothetical protein [Gaiellaceae bacterium]
MRHAIVAAAVALVLAPAAVAATTTPTAPVYDSKGRLVQTPYPPPNSARLTKKKASDIFLHNHEVAHWLKHYPSVVTYDASYSPKDRSWTVHVWSGNAGEVARGKVDDANGEVTEALTGPQVAWGMARGGPGAFGGEKINSKPIWLAFCAVFLLGLADLRRLASLRNLDLLVFLSFTFSLWYFNRGDIFTSVPLAYPPLVYLLGRTLWVGIHGRGSPTRPFWPVWVLVAATVFLAGFKVGLNVQASNVIDVGYAGPIGAERIVHEGQAPYGHFPQEGNLKPCGLPDQNGEIRDRIQTNGRCESANPQADTYGPVSYESYIPAYLVFGWSGKWDSLPAAHATSILFDLLCILGLGLVGLRFGGVRPGATLAFAWAAYPFTQYVSNSNTNDSILPAFLIFGFLFVASPVKRGIFCALSAWTKFAPLIVAPLWLTYPDWRQIRPQVRFAVGFVVATLVAFSILLLEPHPLHALGTFWRHTFKSQIDRESPFSLWDWRQYHANGIPDLHVVQRVLEVLVVIGAVAAAFFPRRKSPLQLAALTAALLIGFEIVLTHWFYLYIPWFFPFAAFALFAPARERAAQVEAPAEREHEVRELVPAG